MDVSVPLALFRSYSSIAQLKLDYFPYISTRCNSLNRNESLNDDIKRYYWLYLDQRAGRNLGRALFEYYKMLGQIPGDYIQSLQPVTGRKKTELTCAYRGMRSRTNMGKHRDEEVFHRANPLILQIEPCLQNSSYRPLVRGIHIKDTIESRPITANSSGQGSSSTAMNSEEAKETSIPSLSVIDFSSLTMTRKELRHIQRRKPASLI